MNSFNQQYRQSCRLGKQEVASKRLIQNAMAHLRPQASNHPAARGLCLNPVDQALVILADALFVLGGGISPGQRFDV